MSLSSGTRLGSYEILAPLGAGGMGEVYRARDARLEREVAVKVLPERVAMDAAARERFEREAKAIAALSHPNILSIFEFGSQDGVAFAVTELLEGETLRLGLARGRLPSRRALEYAQQIAQGLAAAHEKGIVHRDLKPENLFVTADGRIKILDFGLARQEPSREGDDSVSPTLARHTDPGTILGTVGYMSPEQARGAVADHRSDIFSFGSVLYEMLTGERAFQRETAAETLTAILREEPKELASLNASLPPAFDRTLRHCLEKDPSARVQSARDLAFDLELVAGLTTSGMEKLATRGSGPAHARARILWLGVAFLAGAVAAALALKLAGPLATAGSRDPVYLSATLPQDSRLAGSQSLVAISPDGQRLVYSAASTGGAKQLYLRSLSQPQGRPIPGTEGGDTPFFSPDGRWLGFRNLQAGKLRRVPIDGGAPRDLADVAAAVGASWSEDGTLVYAPDAMRSVPLLRVGPEGGKPQPVTALAKGEVDHRWPQLLPGGAAVLFTVELAGKSFDDAHIVVQDLKTGARHVVVEGGSYGRYLTTGHIVYGRHNALHAIPFDPRQLRPTGPSQVLVEGVATTPSGCVQFDIAASGTLVYLPGGGPAAERALIWVDRSGKATRVTEAGRLYNAARLSPDGRRIAAEVAAAENDLWRIESSSGTHTRMTFEAENGSPVWTPDGRSIVFNSNRGGGTLNLYRLDPDASAVVQRLTDSQNEQWPTTVSPDGRTLIFNEWKPDGDVDLVGLSLVGKPEIRPLIQTAFQEEGASISADGRYIAYVSNESGRTEVYAQTFPSLGSKVRVSIDGGIAPIWSSDGREIYFQNGEKIMAASVTPGPPFSASRPKQLLEGSFADSWQVAPDGRFLMIRLSEEETSSRTINVVLNWFEELKQGVPSGVR